MNLHLTDKIALVTGGASGIGEAIVRLLAAEGATPVIADKNADAGLALANDLREQGLRCAVITTDVTREEEIKQCIQHVTDEFRGIDILVNNAAANDVVSLAAGATAFRASLERNLVSVYNVTHYAAASLRARRGAIVNIGSKVASTGQGGTSGYAASKGGVNALTRE